jgi:tetratricopeptide (TPR) repeat protein
LSPTERVNADELRLFAERIRRTLRERPLSVTAEEQREKVAAMLRQLGQASHYDLLGVAAAASPAEVHDGYERVARLVHPMHAQRLGLEGREGVLELLFEHATEAYLTLSKDERRKEYDRELNPDAWAASPSRKARTEEIKDRARSYYSQAINLAAAEDYHFAVELLREAVRWDPKAEYYALLGQVQSKNEMWLHHAAESYRRALELGGSNPTVEAALQKVEERMSGEPHAEADHAPAPSAEPSTAKNPREEHKRWYIP